MTKPVYFIKILKIRFIVRAIIHNKTGYGGYYLRWIDDGWGKRGSDKAGTISARVWYTNELYLKNNVITQKNKW